MCCLPPSPSPSLSPLLLSHPSVPSSSRQSNIPRVFISEWLFSPSFSSFSFFLYSFLRQVVERFSLALFPFFLHSIFLPSSQMLTPETSFPLSPFHCFSFFSFLPSFLPQFLPLFCAPRLRGCVMARPQCLPRADGQTGGKKVTVD